MNIISQENSQGFLMEYPATTASGFQEQYLKNSNPNCDSIVENFNGFMSKIMVSEIQNDVAYKLVEKLINTIDITNSIDIMFEMSVEKEIMFVLKNAMGINFIAIDLEGDIMISTTPYSGQGHRFFFDYKDLDDESVIFNWLS